jgi:hypothetical protein
MAVSGDYTSNLAINQNVRQKTGFQPGLMQSIAGVQIPTLDATFNADGTEDFFVSGEFLKVVSNTNGKLVVDVAKVDLTDPLNPVYPEIISFVECPAMDPFLQVKKIASGTIHKIIQKGDSSKIPVMKQSNFEGWFIGSEAINQGDKVQANNSGNGVSKWEEGEGQLIGIAKSSITTAGQIVKVLLQ